MPECRQHLFIVPLKGINECFLNNIKELASFKSERFLFVLSIQEQDSYIRAQEVFRMEENVYVIHPESTFERTEHWEFVVKFAVSYLEFDTFSYYFFGDDLDLSSFPDIKNQADILLNDYFIDDWAYIKENVSVKALKKHSAKEVIRKKFMLGQPICAPLQKIIFRRRIAAIMSFDCQHSYVSDQIMVHELIEKSFTIGFIKEPFYKINKINRNDTNSIKVSEIIKQQLYLYCRVKCLVGIPAILLRTIVKYLFKIK